MEKEKMKQFYNTVELTPSELLEARGRAISQEDRIFKLLKGNGGQSWTAWIIKEYCLPELEITSIRRALFNLEKQGRIKRAGWSKGPKGVKVGRYIFFDGKLF